MDRRYNTLRFVAGLFKVIAWIVLVLGVLGAIGLVVMGFVGGIAAGILSFGGVINSALGGVIVAIILLIHGILNFALWYAMGGLLDLALAIEENSRRATGYLRGESNL